MGKTIRKNSKYSLEKDLEQQKNAKNKQKHSVFFERDNTIFSFEDEKKSKKRK